MANGANEETVLRAALVGKTYEDLPTRVQSLVSKHAWGREVFRVCAQRRVRYDAVPSLVASGAGSDAYYAEVVRSSVQGQRIFPYHLASEVSAVPFTYYIQVLHASLKRDQGYDQIPNFTAADAVRVTGVGRNEYVAILQACKAHRFLWKLNRDAAVREQLPSQPQDLAVEGWWQIASARGAIAAAADRSRRNQPDAPTPSESSLLASLDRTGPTAVSRLSDTSAWRGLYRKALAIVVVPISDADCISIPPLEGFVSNKDACEDHADPIERLLYVEVKERAHARTHARTPPLSSPSFSFISFADTHHCAQFLPFLSFPSFPLLSFPFLSFPPLLPFLSFPSSPSLPLLPSLPFLSFPFLSLLSFLSGTPCSSPRAHAPPSLSWRTSWALPSPTSAVRPPSHAA